MWWTTAGLAAARTNINDGRSTNANKIALPAATDGYARQEPCRCGCADCAKRCCRLECLVQPRFYCGQLLTDTDLNALLQWTQQKLRLGRYHHGWGVVHGLDVRADPQDPLGIIVSPGYAVDCCGDDIVVCQDYPFSLQALCADEVCLNPWLPRPKPVATQGGPVRDAILDAALAGTAAFDIFIRYDGTANSPPGRNRRWATMPAARARCAYSRTQEAFKLEWRAAGATPAPGPGRDQFPARWPKYAGCWVDSGAVEGGWR